MNYNEMVATFDTTHNALRFEKTLKQNEIGITVMPVPREISASCGLAVKFGRQHIDKVKELTSSNEIQVKGYYQIIIENNKREYVAFDLEK